MSLTFVPTISIVYVDMVQPGPMDLYLEITAPLSSTGHTPIEACTRLQPCLQMERQGGKVPRKSGFVFISGQADTFLCHTYGPMHKQAGQ